MKTRKEKIKEIESLIEENKGTRREFMSSFGKTIALGAMAAMGIASFLSCEKENWEEEVEDKDNDSENKSVCYIHVCGKVNCSDTSGFKCSKKHTCLTSDTCIPKDAYHKGGKVS